MNRSSSILSAVLLATACSAAPDALVDTRWVAAEVGGTPAVSGTSSTLEFTKDGKASGQGGCNRYSGEAKFDHTSLQFGPLAATRMACADPAANGQESRLFAAFAATHSYRQEGPELVLLDIDGKTLVRFRPE